MKFVKGLLSVAAAVLVSGCASNPDKLQTTYISPMQYQSYTCDQIAMDQMRVERRTGELHARLKKEANADNAQMAVGLLLFWPALFFVEGGDGPEAAEYSRLKGEYEALQQVAVQKRCDLRFKNDLSEAAEVVNAEIEPDDSMANQTVPAKD